MGGITNTKMIRVRTVSFLGGANISGSTNL
jgi:hypothetical protein